jgi:hypothetical protein
MTTAMKTNMMSTTTHNVSWGDELDISEFSKKTNKTHKTDILLSENSYGQCTSSPKQTISNKRTISKTRRPDGLPTMFRMTVQNHTKFLGACYSGKTIQSGEAATYRVPISNLDIDQGDTLAINIWHPVFQKTIAIFVTLEKLSRPITILARSSSTEIGVDVGISREGFFRVNIYDVVPLSSRIGTL